MNISYSHGVKCFIEFSHIYPNQLLSAEVEHITDNYITETGTTELENLSHNIIDIFIIET